MVTWYFLRKIVPGGADRSYGIHVAKLAGLPSSVITRAQDVLAQLEQPEYRASNLTTTPISSATLPQPHPLIDEVRQIDLFSHDAARCAQSFGRSSKTRMIDSP